MDFQISDAVKSMSRGPFRRANLKGYIGQMSNPREKGIFDENIAEILSQQGFVWNEEPRSLYDPQQLFDALDLYAPSNERKIKFDSYLDEGFHAAMKAFGFKRNQFEASKLKVLKDIEVLDAMHLNKSSGLPLLTKKAAAVQYSFDRELQIRLHIKSPNPCIAYKRTQVGKTRLVWGYPMEMTIMESRFARPLIEKFLTIRTPMAFGMTKPALGAYLDSSLRSHKWIYALDYSKFDSSIPARLIRMAFDILGTWFSAEDKEKYGWEQIIRYFICTPIVMPDGNLYTGKRHGVPSGSYFTQMIDSIVNVILLVAMSARFRLGIDIRKLFVLGDDSIFSSNIKLPLEEAAEFLSSYGIRLNVDKSRIGEIHFLGADWYFGLPVSDIRQLVTKAVFPETFRVYSKDPVKRKAEALGVVLSYMSTYENAWALLPWGYRVQTQVQYALKSRWRPEFLSGSEKFLETEFHLGRVPRDTDAHEPMERLFK